MKYKITIDGYEVAESDSRDSKRHLQNQGGNVCRVLTKGGRCISEARRDESGKIYNCVVYNP